MPRNIDAVLCPGCGAQLPKDNQGCPCCGYENNVEGRLLTVAELLSSDRSPPPRLNDVSPAFLRAFAAAVQPQHEPNPPEVAPAKLRGTSPYAFRAGEWAQVIGVAVVTPKGLAPRPCYVVRYADGVLDRVAVQDVTEYELVSGDLDAVALL